ncbi:MAG: transposase, partial [Nitrosomonas sp.]|nr:transposase [Nitrosomonas sp.]
MTDLVQAFQLDLTQQTETVYALELKIQVLTLELAHLRRIRFGRKNEALSALSPRQLSLFEESALTDITAIEAEIEQVNSTPTPNTTKLPRTRAGQRALPPFFSRRSSRSSCCLSRMPASQALLPPQFPRNRRLVQA